jgi:hypothetical protein
MNVSQSIPSRQEVAELTLNGPLAVPIHEMGAVAVGLSVPDTGKDAQAFCDGAQTRASRTSRSLHAALFLKVRLTSQSS